MLISSATDHKGALHADVQLKHTGTCKHSRKLILCRLIFSVVNECYRASTKDMGNKQVTFTDDQFDAYQDVTFFARKDILRIFKRYRDLNSDLVPKDMTQGAAHVIRVPRTSVERMPEFKENPFKRRICEVFSEDGQGNMTFDDFLDMFSVFSEAAPRDIKAIYAFKIYDFDGDNFLGKQDLARTVSFLTRNELSPEEVDFVSDKVLEEADLDDDGKLSYTEFEHVISRSPDFLGAFHIRI